MVGCRLSRSKKTRPPVLVLATGRGPYTRRGGGSQRGCRGGLRRQELLPRDKVSVRPEDDSNASEAAQEELARFLLCVEGNTKIGLSLTD